MANNFPNLRPTLNLDMVNGIYVDPRVTFTRAGTRTFFGREMVKAEENLLLNSATLSTQSVTVAATAYTLSFTGTGTITLSGASTAGPLIGTGVSDRVSLTFTPTAGTLTLTVVGLVTLAQLENRSSLTAYTATTTQPITRYQRLLRTAAANEWPREFDPVTGECLGRSVWESRTNRCLRAEEFDNAAWVKTNVTVAANQTIAPNGTLTADQLTASAANGTVIQDLGVVASAAKTGSLYLKRYTGTGNIEITLNGGSTWTAVTLTSTWTRFNLTATLADEDFGIRIVTSGDSVFAWGGMVETGAFQTPYIPTVASQITRLADSAVMTGTNFSSWFNPSEGALFVDTTNVGQSATSVSLSDGTTSNRINLVSRIVGSSTGDEYAVVVTGGTGQASLSGQAYTKDSKSSISYKFNEIRATMNGNTPRLDSIAVLPIVNRLAIGAVATQGSIYIKRLTYYPQALTAANLQAITR